MAVTKANINGNPNVGLYGYCTDSLAILGEHPTDRVLKEIERVLSVPIHFVKLAGTNMTGVFMVGNATGVIVPSIAFDAEVEELKKHIPLTILETKQTCLGNNIVCNDTGAVTRCKVDSGDPSRCASVWLLPTSLCVPRHLFAACVFGACRRPAVQVRGC